MSQPTRAAWIEISTLRRADGEVASQPTRAAWIEIANNSSTVQPRMSQPTRAAWIEIEQQKGVKSMNKVAAHSGCVD